MGRRARKNKPRRTQQLVPHHDELGDDAGNIQVRAVGKEEVPEAQDLGKGRRTGAQGQHGRKGVDLGRQPLRRQVQAQLDVDDRQHLVDERQAPVHAVHSPANVPRTLFREQSMERHKGLGLAARGVQERRR